MQINGFRRARRLRASGVIFSFSFLLAACSALLCAPVYAQIVAHPGAAAASLPQITASKNGVPLVDIAAPSAGGVSRNQFSQFDVDKRGAILNNASANSLTRLGGWVPGNAQLGPRAARVIVGEVLSAQRSILQGYLEVAGSRADVILANPSGITCNGCGFINTSRATLSTGLPVYDASGRVTGWQVRKGEILIGAAGLDAREAEELDLFARSMKVQGLVRAQQLYGVTGANAIDHDTLLATEIEADASEPKPLLAVDVSRMGNFYANQIYLIGTEKDLGLASDGSLSATAGRLELDFNGNVSYRSASAQSDVRIASSQKVVMGEQTASESGDVIVRAESIQNTGRVRAGGGGDQSQAEGATLLIAKDIENTSTGDIATANTVLRATNTITNRGVIDGRRVRLDAQTLANIGTGRIYGDRIAIQARNLMNHAESVNGQKTAATIAARERLDLGVETISNRGGSLIFSADSGAIGGALDAQGNATGTAQSIVNEASTIETLGALDIDAREVKNFNEGFSTKQTTTEADVYEKYIEIGGQLWREEELGRCHACADDKNDDGSPRLARLEFVPPDPAKPYTAGYSKTPYQVSNQSGLNAFLADATYDYHEYAANDPVWRLFGVAVGDYQSLAPQLAAYNAAFIARAQRVFNIIEVTHEQVEKTERLSAGIQARLLSGGDMTIKNAALLNDNSVIIAGGKLSTVGSSLTNTQVLSKEVSRTSGIRHKSFVKYSGYQLQLDRFGKEAYAGVAQKPSEPIGSSETVSQRVPAGSGRVVASLSTDSLKLPQSSLYHLNIGSSTSPLVETDPRFTNYRNWLGTEYLAEQLQVQAAGTSGAAADRAKASAAAASMHQHLGDPFYEQRLISQQIEQLTGQKFLKKPAVIAYSAAATEAAEAAEEQFKSLMDNGVKAASTLGLTLGVALTKEQLEKLDGDIVWLELQTVTVADGVTTTALVPKVYLHPSNAVLDNAGGLIGAAEVAIESTGAVDNAGTILARSDLAIHGGEVVNSGDISGGRVSIESDGNIKIVGGTVQAEESLALSAGGDVVVETTTQTANNKVGNSNTSETRIDRVAGLYVSKGGDHEDGEKDKEKDKHSNPVDEKNSAGKAPTLSITAKGKASFIGSEVVNNGGGSTKVDAIGGIVLGAVKEGHSQITKTDGKPASYENSWSQETGAAFSALGDLGFKTNGDFDATAAQIDGNGALDIDAKGKIDIGVGEASSTYAETRASTERHVLSRHSTNSETREEQSIALGSNLSAKSMSLKSGGDTTITGSNLAAEEDLSIRSLSNVKIQNSENSQHSYASNDTNKSGVGANGGSSIGKNRQKSRSESKSTFGTASNVGSLKDNVNIYAENKYEQAGSNVLAREGEINIDAGEVDVHTSHDTSEFDSYSETRTAGLTFSASNSALATAKKLKGLKGIGKQIGGAGAGRAQSLGAAAGALGAWSAMDSAADLLVNPMAAASVGITASLGASSSKSESHTFDSTAQKSNLAGKKLSITSRKRNGSSGNSHLEGAELSGQDGVHIEADGSATIESAQNTHDEWSSNQSTSASIGVTGAVGGRSGTSLNASVNGSRGSSSGHSVTQVNTHVASTNGPVVIKTGADLNIAGATIKGPEVEADVGGNLNIESRQDTSNYTSTQQSVGAGISGCIPPACTGPSSISGSVGNTKVTSNFASVAEQSGVRSGDRGFKVKVKKNTNLVGGAITSTEIAVANKKNDFHTGGVLTSRDLRNVADFKVDGVQISVTVAGKEHNGAKKDDPDGKQEGDNRNPTSGQTGGGAGVGHDSGHAESQTRSGISGFAGNSGARTGDVETGIAPIFDKEKSLKKVADEIAATQTLGAAAAKKIGDFAEKELTEAAKLRTTADGETDPKKKADLLDRASSIESKWGELGTYRIGAHAVAGALTGGVGGAAGGAAGAATAPLVANGLKRVGVDGVVADAITVISSTGAGALAGGASGAAAATNEVMNNYLKHPELQLKDKQLAACKTDKCRADVRKRWDKVSQDRNAQIEMSCLDSGVSQCRENLKEMEADLELLRKHSIDPNMGSRGMSPEKSNNIRQVDNKIRGNLDYIADEANKSLGTTISGTKKMLEAGLITEKERDQLDKQQSDILGTIAALMPNTSRPKKPAAKSPGGIGSNIVGEGAEALKGPVVPNTLSKTGLPDKADPALSVTPSVGNGARPANAPGIGIDGYTPPANPTVNATGTLRNGKSSLPTHVMDEGPDAFGGSHGIYGTHSKEKFETALSLGGGVIQSSTPVAGAEGISVIRYRLPNQNSATKTVFDPKIYSESEIEKMSLSAAQKAINQAAASHTSGTFQVPVGGLTWKVIVTPNSAGMLDVKTAFPIGSASWP